MDDIVPIGDILSELLLLLSFLSLLGVVLLLFCLYCLLCFGFDILSDSLLLALLQLGASSSSVRSSERPRRLPLSRPLLYAAFHVTAIAIHNRHIVVDVAVLAVTARSAILLGIACRCVVDFVVVTRKR